MKWRSWAVALALLAMVQPSVAGQAEFEATMVIQAGLNRTGDYYSAIDGKCSSNLADAAQRFAERNGNQDEAKGWKSKEKFCDEVLVNYLFYFQGHEPFAVEKELGFRTVSDVDIKAVESGCGQLGVEFPGVVSVAALRTFLLSLVDTPVVPGVTPEDEKRANKLLRCMLTKL